MPLTLTVRPRSMVTVWMPRALGHHRVVPSPSFRLASEVPGAEPEFAAARAPMAMSRPSGSSGRVPAVAGAAGAAPDAGSAVTALPDMIPAASATAEPRRLPFLSVPFLSRRRSIQQPPSTEAVPPDSRSLSPTKQDCNVLNKRHCCEDGLECSVNAGLDPATRGTSASSERRGGHPDRAPATWSGAGTRPMPARLQVAALTRGALPTLGP